MRSKRNSSKKPLFVALGFCALVVIVIAALELTNTTYFFHSKPADTAANPAPAQSKTDLLPASAADNAANNTRKESTTPSQTLDQGTTTTPSNAAVTTTNVSNSDPIHVGTLVSGVTSGTCTATLTLQSDTSQKVQATSSVVLQNSSYTCGALNVSKSSLPASGKYQVFVTLDSAKSNVLSDVDLTK